MIEADELYHTFTQALYVSKFENMHEGLVILKTFMAILEVVLECKDVTEYNAFWVAGINSIELILSKRGENNE